MKKPTKNRVSSALPISKHQPKEKNMNRSQDFFYKKNKFKINSIGDNFNIINKNIDFNLPKDDWLNNFMKKKKLLEKKNMGLKNNVNNNKLKEKKIENNRYNFFNQSNAKRDSDNKNKNFLPSLVNKSINIKKPPIERFIPAKNKKINNPVINPIISSDNFKINKINPHNPIKNKLDLNKFINKNKEKEVPKKNNINKNNIINNINKNKEKNKEKEIPRINNINNNNIINNINKNKEKEIPKINNINNNNIINENNINNNVLKNDFQIDQPKEKKHNRHKSSTNPNPKKFILLSKTNANGLANIGATCYMNATLQCLAHIQKLTYYLLNSEIKTKLSLNKYKYQLSDSYLTVLENLWQNKNIQYYSPHEFKQIISKMNPLFAGVQANDSKDLILFLLENMHQELNEKINNNDIQEENTDDLQAQYNYEITFKNFSQYYAKNFNSIISNLFYGMFNSLMNCQNCGVITNNVQCFNILIFPLQKVKEFKMRYENIVDIYECFDYYQKPDYMGGRSYYCNNCKQMVDNINANKLLYGPKILVINLNRGKGLEFDIKLNFPEYIDIINYVFYKEGMPSYYELVGIVTHFGPSGMSGHFIAFCKSFGNQQWYKYNDAIVNQSSFDEAKNTGVPYILFYSYIKR